MAEEQELDLVEISPNAVPPVCKIMDYRKFVYTQKKKQKELKAKQSKTQNDQKAFSGDLYRQYPSHAHRSQVFAMRLLGC